MVNFKGSLKEKITNSGTIKEAEAKIYIKQILQGLEYLHSKKLIHRDLKCSNILCDTNGDIKLSDFGTTKQLKDLTKSGLNQTTKQFDSFVGTPHFMSPEMIKGEKYGRKVDIWYII